MNVSILFSHFYLIFAFIENSNNISIFNQQEVDAQIIIVKGTRSCTVDISGKVGKFRKVGTRDKERSRTAVTHAGCSQGGQTTSRGGRGYGRVPGQCSKSATHEVRSHARGYTTTAKKGCAKTTTSKVACGSQGICTATKGIGRGHGNKSTARTG